MFGEDGWSSGVSRRAASVLQPSTCYRNAIVGGSSAHGLWFLNNDAGFDVRHFAQSYMRHYMKPRPSRECPVGGDGDGADDYILEDPHRLREGTQFKDCSLTHATVMIIKNTKSRGHYAAVAAATGLVELFLPSVWGLDDVGAVARAVMGGGDACVKVWVYAWWVL